MYLGCDEAQTFMLILDADERPLAREWLLGQSGTWARVEVTAISGPRSSTQRRRRVQVPCPYCTGVYRNNKSLGAHIGKYHPEHRPATAPKNESPEGNPE